MAWATDIKRRDVVKLLGGAAAAWPSIAHAQQSDRVPRIGVLLGLAENDPDTTARLSGFRLEIERLGWSEPRNIRIDYRFAPAGLQANVLAKELVALQPNVILAQATPVVDALRRETQTIPIVFVGIADPLGSGFVASLARPGGNLTGSLLFEASITGKWLAMLKEIAPHLTRAALVMNPKTAVYHDYFVSAARAVAASLSIEVVFTPIENAGTDIERVIDAFARVPHSGLVLPPDTNTIIHRDLLIALAARHRLPAVYSDRLFVTAGGLIGYSTDRVAQYRMAARYVDRILRGSKPADLPVLVPTRYETIVNLKAAKALSLTVPPAILLAADELVE